MDQETKQIRRAVMHVNLDMIRDALRLPRNVELMVVVPPTQSNLEYNTATLLLASEQFDPLESGQAVPVVNAKFRGGNIRSGDFVFDRFDTVAD